MTQNPLGYEKLSKLLKKYAIPSIIAMLVSALYNIVDQIFIGQGVGYLGNAATNVSFPLVTICLAIALLVGVGSASGLSLALGAKDEKRAQSLVASAITMMVVLSGIYLILVLIFLDPLLFAFGATGQVLPYAKSYASITALGMPLLIMTNVLSNLIRADGSPKYSMQCMLIGAIVNTILDPIMIFIFKMGVAGAAIATVVGQACSFVMAVLYVKQFKHVKLHRSDFKFNMHNWLEIAELGMSSSLNQVAITFVQIVMNHSLVHYGSLSIYGPDIPLAACGIVMKTNSILLSVIIGLSQASQPIFGFNYGAKQFDRVKEAYLLASKCVLTVGAVGVVLFQIFPKQIISIFGSGDALYFDFAVKFMRIFLLMVLINGIQMISSTFFSAIGKPVIGSLLSLTRQVLFLIPLIILLPLYFGLDGILFSAPVADVAAFIVSFLYVKREFKLMDKINK